jgi:alpha-galactosidase
MGGVVRRLAVLGEFQAQSTFSLWSMFSSMLMATNDVRSRNTDIEAILLNKEVIRVNQDPWGVSAVRISPSGQCGGQQWARQLSNGDVGVLVLNRDDTVTIVGGSWLFENTMRGYSRKRGCDLEISTCS